MVGQKLYNNKNCANRPLHMESVLSLDTRMFICPSFHVDTEVESCLVLTFCSFCGSEHFLASYTDW